MKKDEIEKFVEVAQLRASVLAKKDTLIELLKLQNAIQQEIEELQAIIDNMEGE